MSVTSLAIQFTMVDLLSKGVNRIRDRLKGLASAGREVQGSFDKMTKSFKYAAIAGIATREIYKGLKPAVSAAGDLQEELIGVKTELMGAGKDTRKLNAELKAVKASAFSIQAWTPFDMGQIVALEKELIKAGARIEHVTGKTGAAAAAAALATYESVDPVETGKALIRIATPFELTADKYLELADTIARASSASTADMADIVLSAKYAAAKLASLGRSTKEMAAMSALMSQLGLQGETGGRAIREFYQKISESKAYRDANGNLIKTTKILEKFRAKYKGLGEAELSTQFKKDFGELGAQTALALMKEGETSYEAIIDAMDKAASLQEKITESMKGFNKQLNSLKGTSKSVIADLYTPALKPLTALILKTNEFVAAIGNVAQKDESLSKRVSALSLGAVATGGAATLGLAGAGLYYGRKVLKGTGGFKGLFSGTAAGIAKGKLIESATGVQPVFVTNWPGYIGGGTSADLIKGGKGLKGILSLLGKAGKFGGYAAAGAGLLAGGAALGYGAVSMMEKYLQPLVDKIYGVNAQPEININNTIHIDENGRVISETDSLKHRARNKVKRGAFIPAQ
jgi:TP901 family phage tail tape measure protein